MTKYRRITASMQRVITYCHEFYVPESVDGDTIVEWINDEGDLWHAILENQYVEDEYTEFSATQVDADRNPFEVTQEFAKENRYIDWYDEDGYMTDPETFFEEELDD